MVGNKYLAVLLPLLIVGISANPIQKSLSIFNIVKFANDPCLSSEMKNGTCYTDAECQTREGTASGSCAEGYGVCCVFSIRCGGSSSENNTYFQSTGTETGSCNVNICPLAGVCQLRLDFSKFDISQPSAETSATLAVKSLNGAINPDGLDVTDMGQCLTDTFAVTSPGSATPPVICGSNDGQHMYVDASEACNILAFQLSGDAKRSWEIKIVQLSCDFSNLAPTGCTQWFYGEVEGQIQSFNFNGGQHLANQNQNICIRRELNNCQICYSAASMQFDLTTMLADDFGVQGKSGMCCGYGPMAMFTGGYDCIIIPQGSRQADGADLIGSEFCGRGLFTIAMFPSTTAATMATFATICSKSVPFHVRFLSDSWEMLASEVTKNPDGFKIDFKQEACT